MTTEGLNEETRDEWRELGFFYDYDNKDSCWRFVGSRPGLRKFCDILDRYAADERSMAHSEHEHYGPYSYLKVVTWDEPVITRHDIRGTVDDLKRLSGLIKDKLGLARTGDKFVIDSEYSQANKAAILFEVQPEDFDAASADPLL